MRRLPRRIPERSRLQQLTRVRAGIPSAQAAALAAAVEAAALAQTGDFTAAGAPVGQLARLHTRHAEEAMANQVARCQAEVGTIPYTYIWYIEHGLLKELDEAMHREVEASLKRGNL